MNSQFPENNRDYMVNHEEMSYIMAVRLKKLREEHGYSHDKLSSAINERFGIKISSDSLMNYEVSDPHHTKALKNQGMSVKYLHYLADFYGVSTDYLLGFDVPKVMDPSAQGAINFTGLSEETILVLHGINTMDENHNFDSRLPAEMIAELKKAQDPKLLRYELLNLIEMLIKIIVIENPLFYGPSFQNAIWGLANSRIHKMKADSFTPDANYLDELHQNGYHVIRSNRYAKWEIDSLFDMLKSRTMNKIYEYVRINHNNEMK